MYFEKTENEILLNYINLQTINVNSEHYAEGGPIFIFIKQGIFDNGWLDYGNIANMAQELNGIVIEIEPRFLSRSDRPTANLSLDNLKYLTIKQTLNDYAVIINYIRQQIPTSSRVIVFGNGHGGRMATWLKQSNPLLIDGAYAVSAPLNVEFEFAEYFEDVASLFLNETIIPNAGRCVERIGLAFYELAEIIESGDTTRINTLFNLTEPLDASDPGDVGSFFQEIILMISTNVEFGT